MLRWSKNLTKHQRRSAGFSLEPWRSCLQQLPTALGTGFCRKYNQQNRQSRSSEWPTCGPTTCLTISNDRQPDRKTPSPQSHRRPMWMAHQAGQQKICTGAAGGAESTDRSARYSKGRPPRNAISPQKRLWWPNGSHQIAQNTANQTIPLL